MLAFASHLELFEALDKCPAGAVDIGVIAYKRIAFGAPCPGLVKYAVLTTRPSRAVSVAPFKFEAHLGLSPGYRSRSHRR